MTPLTDKEIMGRIKLIRAVREKGLPDEEESEEKFWKAICEQLGYNVEEWKEYEEQYFAARRMYKKQKKNSEFYNAFKGLPESWEIRPFVLYDYEYCELLDGPRPSAPSEAPAVSDANGGNASTSNNTN